MLFKLFRLLKTVNARNYLTRILVIKTLYNVCIPAFNVTFFYIVFNYMLYSFLYFFTLLKKTILKNDFMFMTY